MPHMGSAAGNSSLAAPIKGRRAEPDQHEAVHQQIKGRLDPASAFAFAHGKHK
jgi:hypothetical protein